MVSDDAENGGALFSGTDLFGAGTSGSQRYVFRFPGCPHCTCGSWGMSLVYPTWMESQKEICRVLSAFMCILDTVRHFLGMFNCMR